MFDFFKGIPTLIFLGVFKVEFQKSPGVTIFKTGTTVKGIH